MNGEITKIDPVKKSANGNAFIRVYFKIEGKDWYKTDICPDYRNYARWKPLLKVGNMLSGLEAKGDTTINADSWPKLVVKVVVDDRTIDICKDIIKHLYEIKGVLPAKDQVASIVTNNFSILYKEAELAFDIAIKEYQK